MASNSVYWPGVSGAKYEYFAYPISTPLLARAGNYIYAKLNQFHQWVPVYIGETEDLNQRLTTHEKRECVRLNGATHIHAHLTTGLRENRLMEETDLRNNFVTTCNVQ